MNTPSSSMVPQRLQVVVTLAHVLERLERSSDVISADQYRTVVNRLAHELAQVATDVALPAVLDAYPAAAELYENLNYQYAGLCRSPLEISLASEGRAKEILQHAARRQSDKSLR